jgi:membrane protease YdiL (CAAX protease family)
MNMDRTRWGKVYRFIMLTFVVNWLLAVLFFMLFKNSGPTAYNIMALIYMLIPMTVAMLLTTIKDKGSIRELGISFKINRYFGLAWLFPVALMMLTIGVNLLFPQVFLDASPDGIVNRMGGSLSEDARTILRSQIEAAPLPPFWMGLIQGLIAGATINALFAFGEEYGWRGYLLDTLSPLGFWKASLFIGIIWGIWHAPLIFLFGHNYPFHRVAGVAMMVIFCVLLSFVHTFVRLKSGSVIAAAILHGTINGLAGLPVMVLEGGNDLTNGMTGLAGFIALVILLVPIAIYVKKISSTTNEYHLDS